MNKSGAVVLLGAVLLAFQSNARGDALGDQLKSLLQARAASIVNVRMVLKSQSRGAGPARESETKMEMPGTVVDSSGLIMMSNLPYSPTTLRNLLSGPSDDDQQQRMEVTPTDFKVLVGNDPAEHSAFIAATDSKLGLTFLQLDDAAAAALQPVDLSGEADAAVGDTVVTVGRLRKGYDYAPFFQVARIAGAVAKPRAAWLLDGGAPFIGSPVYNAAGVVLGVLTTIEPSTVDETDLSTMSFTTFTAQRFGTAPPLRLFLVASHPVYADVRLAMQQASKLLAERKKSGLHEAPPPAASPPAAPPTKAGKAVRPTPPGARPPAPAQNATHSTSRSSIGR